MSDPVYDALVIGGGPAGSTAATVLARAGRKALVLEKERFPRFHIGESLLPYNRQIFAQIGVLPKLEAAGLIRKYGAQFHLGNGSRKLELIFRNGKFTREAEAFQVERAHFDQLLLQHSRESGADVEEGCVVTKFVTEPEAITIHARDCAGNARSFRGKFLIDASGRGNLTGNQEGLRIVHEQLKKVAVFGHFTGVAVAEGPQAGDTVIVRLENKWFWLIPIGPDKVSVGCVMDQHELASAKKPPADIFFAIVRDTPVLQERMRRARLAGTIQTTSDFSYHNRRFVGPRLVRVGDAAGFMDPIFSAGVYLAMYSAKSAAETILAALREGTDGARLFKKYERRILTGMKIYWELVEGFYTTPFMELLLSPREKFHLASAVTAIFAGEVEGGWKLQWRLRLFFALVRLQRHWPLVPRISFGAASPQ